MVVWCALGIKSFYVFMYVSNYKINYKIMRIIFYSLNIPLFHSRAYCKWVIIIQIARLLWKHIVVSCSLSDQINDLNTIHYKQNQIPQQS